MMQLKQSHKLHISPLHFLYSVFSVRASVSVTVTSSLFSASASASAITSSSFFSAGPSFSSSLFSAGASVLASSLASASVSFCVSVTASAASGVLTSVGSSFSFVSSGASCFKVSSSVFSTVGSSVTVPDTTSTEGLSSEAAGCGASVLSSFVCSVTTFSGVGVGVSTTSSVFFFSSAFNDASFVSSGRETFADTTSTVAIGIPKKM
uniref:Uncharacterized protein n=1 Tax=Glycine max TaxID=3847 RepID=C6TF70_SOYBN|nr:unknown [Glycine max]